MVRVVISSTQSERNDGFNGNHEELCARSSYAAHSERDDDLLSCMHTVCLLLPAQALNLQSVHTGYQDT